MVGSRGFLLSVFVIFAIGFVGAQIPDGGWYPVPKNQEKSVIKLINGLTLTGGLKGAKLYKIYKADQQVVAGKNYRVKGKWKTSSGKKKKCTIIVYKPLSGAAQVKSINC